MVLSPGTVSTQSNHTVQSESLKRPKESSSSIGVSPDTARCRPPSKRPSGVARSLLFSLDSCELVSHACSINSLHFDANLYRAAAQCVQTEETTVDELVSQQRADSVTNDNCNGK